MNRKVLIVDDEPEMCSLVETSLQPFNYSVQTCTSGEDALALLADTEFNVLLSDLQMPGITGIELCSKALALQPNLCVVLFTGFGSMNVVVDALRAGAYDFVTKPVSLQVLALTLQRAMKHQELKSELRRLNELLAAQPAAAIAGEGSAMRDVFNIVDRTAKGDATVLILGETGTGKEVVARAIHERSGRTGPFLAINCSAVPENLLESELFGHVPGAFTDARTTRMGLFVEANGGTLFLDEIGEMPLAMQSKLLRALQERTVRPLGASKETRFDARIIAATNRDLEAQVTAKRFREDLFYRINVVTISIPPLRARIEDVLPLARHFVVRAATRTGRPPVRLAERAAERLLEHDWPGNVRELENCIERAFAFARYDEITADDLPDNLRGPTSTARDDGLAGLGLNGLPEMQVVEERYVRKVLDAVQGNKTAAANVLGIDRRTLYRKLAQWNGEPETAEEEPAP